MLMLCTLVLMLEFNVTFSSIKIANTIALVMHIWIFNHVAINSFSNATFSVNTMGLLLVLAFKHSCFLFSCCIYKAKYSHLRFSQSFTWKTEHDLKDVFSVVCCSNQALLWIKPTDENIVQSSFHQNAITSKAYSKKTTNWEHLSLFSVSKDFY